MTLTRGTGVTAPSGFRAAGVAAGVKKRGGLDMALVVNDGPALRAAAVFTTNRFQAAPVVWSREVMTDGEVRAIVLNSGGANACTGQEGYQDSVCSAQWVAEELTARNVITDCSHVAVCSTGVIGDRLPMDAIHGGIHALVEVLEPSHEAGTRAAEAIMTTDTVSKQCTYSAQAGWTIGAMVKGAGMIAPSLATMLCVITTDADVALHDLQRAVDSAASLTFDRLDVDGSTSTNDTVAVLANGASGIAPTPEEFAAALHLVCDDLVEQMMGDAEGVTKCCTITVSGAATEEDALTAARVVARDNLVKTALFGEDPNWGRVLATLGVAPVAMDVDQVAVAFNNKVVFAHGTGQPGARTIDMSGPRITLTIDLGVGGEGTASIRTTDLSHAYVEINSAYTT